MVYFHNTYLTVPFLQHSVSIVTSLYQARSWVCLTLDLKGGNDLIHQR